MGKRTEVEASRRPPAYQEYGSDLLGLEDIRLMSLAERGMLATLRWYVWTNNTIPRDPRQLARVLGLEEQEIRAAMTERVLRFFAPCSDDESRLHSPELSEQMSRLLTRRMERSESGRKGGESSARNRNSGQAELQAQPQAQHGAVFKLAEKSRTEKIRTELSKGDGLPSQDEVIEMQRAFGESC